MARRMVPSDRRSPGDPLVPAPYRQRSSVAEEGPTRDPPPEAGRDWLVVLVILLVLATLAWWPTVFHAAIRDFMGFEFGS